MNFNIASKEMQSLVSIIVPCFNQAEYLGTALNSVICQTYSNWECIIVNDGSTDNTEEIALAFCRKNKNFVYLRQENAGLSSARNTAINSSNGVYILPVDADDKIGPLYLDLAIKKLECNPDVKIVYCNAEFFGSESGAWNLPFYSKETMLRGNVIFCSAMYRKQDFIDVGGYDERMVEGFEDWEFWLSILKNGGIVYKLPETMFYYRKKSSSMLTGITEEIRLKNLAYVYNKHASLLIEVFGNPMNLNSELNFYRTFYNKMHSNLFYKFYHKMLIFKTILAKS